MKQFIFIIILIFSTQMNSTLHCMQANNNVFETSLKELADQESTDISTISCHPLCSIPKAKNSSFFRLKCNCTFHISCIYAKIITATDEATHEFPNILCPSCNKKLNIKTIEFIKNEYTALVKQATFYYRNYLFTNINKDIFLKKYEQTSQLILSQDSLNIIIETQREINERYIIDKKKENNNSAICTLS